MPNPNTNEAEMSDTRQGGEGAAKFEWRDEWLLKSVADWLRAHGTAHGWDEKECLLTAARLRDIGESIAALAPDPAAEQRLDDALAPFAKYARLALQNGRADAERIAGVCPLPGKSGEDFAVTVGDFRRVAALLDQRRRGEQNEVK
jgi:hypothetical protein